MDPGFGVSVIQNMVITVLTISIPIVGVGLMVGFSVSLFQAVTQIQEQTLTFVPKMIVVLGMFALTSPWILSLLVGFAKSLWLNFPTVLN